MKNTYWTSKRPSGTIPVVKALSLLAGVLLFCLPLSAQKLTVESLEYVPNDAAAASYETQMQDINGNYAGVVKVQIALDGVQFEGGGVLKQEKRGINEYWVWMAQGSNRLKVLHPSFLPLEVNFRMYEEVKIVKPKLTYKLVITVPVAGAVQQDDGMRYLAMMVEPKTATLTVNGQQLGTTNGEFKVLLPKGTYDYEVSAPNYASQNGRVTLDDNTAPVQVHLKESTASLAVVSTTEHAQIYVNGQLKGTSSWQGSLSPGYYKVEARLNGYRSYSETVNLTANADRTLTIPALVAVTGSLNVNYSPIGSEVYIDGQKVGITPNIFRNVSVGSHKVEIRKEDYVSASQTVTVEENKQANMSGNLTKLTNEDAEIEGRKPGGLRSLGHDYLEGTRGKTQDYAKALKCFIVAAERGDTDAMVDIGYMYNTGRGVTQNYSEAIKWFRKAAEQGHAQGQIMLGNMYENGKGVAQDYAEALKWYRKAAEQGNDKGQEHLGDMYLDGHGVPKDYSKAMQWFRLSAEQGNAWSQSSLGYMYSQGYGVTKDDIEAVKWYRKSAEQGNVAGQDNLGHCYQYGKGVSKDLQQARYWYEKAAAQGSEFAKSKLSELSGSDNAAIPTPTTGANKTFTVNGVSFDMVYVEGGTFTMGATSEQESDAQDDEKPAHSVTLSSYYIGETEVTQELWQAVMGKNPSKFKGMKRAVEKVSWDDCQKFIEKLNSLTGLQFHLPTEAQWEYAARGGNKSHGYKYSGGNSIDDVARYVNNSHSETQTVATKYPNELGLYDMSGNVFEWCQDWHDSYHSTPQTDPTGATSGLFRIYRGGSWVWYAQVCRISARKYVTPSFRAEDLGLRLAL